MSNLRRNEAALQRVAAWGLDEAACEALGLGIKEPYVTRAGRVVEGVLAYPLTVAGRKRFGCINLPGVTTNAEHPRGWSAGEPATVRHGTGSGVIVVADCAVTVWRLGLAAARIGADVVVVSSSQPDRCPAEWGSQRFWSRWPRVIVLAEVGAATRSAIATAARRPLEVGTTTAPQTEGPATAPADEGWLSDVLDGVGRIQGMGIDQAEAADDEGDYAAAPIALHGGFARGNLLYPFSVERRTRGGAGARLVHRYETLVLRGDGAILEAQVLPAPPGTPRHRKVHALTDGTRILAAPEQSRTASWSLEGIRAYSAARLEGTDPCRRRPIDILQDVHSFIRSAVTLPEERDGWVATGFVAMTHMFRIFSALPILLVHGEKGSGKSELASTIASLGFNATIMAQGSAAALVRLSAECGGLVVLDDVEGLRSEAGGFSDLAQVLKSGYKASTARKPLAGATGRVEVCDFFGPRLLTTTRGVDPVLGSRCIAIGTRCDEAPRPSTDWDPASLRDGLHALAMSRAAEVHAAYILRAAGTVGRADEIRAPLLAIADAFGCGAIETAVMDNGA